MSLKSIQILFLFFSLCMIPCAAQTQDEAQKQRAEFEQKALEQLNERIDNFLVDLQADDFQKEIIKQKLNSYYDKKKVVFMDQTLKYYEREEKLNLLDASHFSDIKNMVSEDIMDKIQLFIKDAGTTLEKQKKKRKKKKKKTE